MAIILSVGPNPEVLAARNRALMCLGHEVRGATSRGDALAIATSGHFQIALLCNEFPAGYAEQLAQQLRQLMPQTSVLRLPDGVPASIRDIDDLIRASLGSRREAA